MRHKIDLGPAGRRGVEAEWWVADGALRILIAATDSRADWWHHVLPWAKRREIRAASEIIVEVFTSPVFSSAGRISYIVVGGHSWGGCIAEIVAGMLDDAKQTVFCVSVGGKRAPWEYQRQRYSIRYRHKGDIVPFLPPWRPARRAVVFGEWEPFWLAHRLDRYEGILTEHGL